jgi:hypothetical protein
MPFIDYVLGASPDPGSAKHTPAEELQHTIWERWARIHMRNRLRSVAYRGIFDGGYIDSQATGGFAVKQWKYADGAFVFRFHDGDGLFRTSAPASRHFTEVSFATMLSEDHFTRTMHFEGWRFAPTRDATSVLNACQTPFIELRKVLYAVSAAEKQGDPPILVADSRLPQLEFDALTADERAAVTDALSLRRCACQLCEYYRPRVQKLVEKREAKESASAEKPVKKTAKKTAKKG